MYESFARCFRTIGEGGESARIEERDGLLASIVPAAPERSVFNSVIYEEPKALEGALDELAGAYEDAGVLAWTVWVPESDRVSAALVKAAGHRLDASPRAMELELAELADPEPGDLDWSDRGSPESLMRINDAAYGYERGTFARGLGSPPEGAYELYEARLDGEVASVLGTMDHGRDCGVYWVATLPGARGGGLAGRLLHLAVAAARDRGCRTSTLQSSGAGFSVYSRLGYRETGTLEMWERRLGSAG